LRTKQALNWYYFGAKDAIVAYLPQHLLATDGATVMEETSKAFGEIFGMKAEIDEK
jgi:ATP-binding cassette subfamily F protein 3